MRGAGCKRHHCKCAWAICIDGRWRADAVLPHQRAQTREECRHLFGRRMRTREQRVLEYPARCRIDHDGDLINRRRRRMRFEIEEGKGPQGPYVANGRGQLQAASVNVARDESELHVKHGRAAIAPLETR